MEKKLVLSVVILCGFTMSLLAQGIQFREGSWKENPGDCQEGKQIGVRG